MTTLSCFSALFKWKSRSVTSQRRLQPGLALGKAVLGDGCIEEAGTPSRPGRGAVPSAAHDGGIGEVLVEVVDVLDPPPVRGAAHRDEVEHREVLNHLAQTHATCVGADGHAELGGEHEDGEVLVDTAHPAGIDLDDIDRLRLE